MTLILPYNNTFQKYKLSVDAKDPANKDADFANPVNANPLHAFELPVQNTESVKQSLLSRQTPREHAMDTIDAKETHMPLLHKETDSTDFFEMAPFGITLILPDGAISRANKIFCQTLGYTQGDYLTGKNISDLIWTDETIHQDKLTVSNLIALEGESLEMRLINKEGNLIYALIKNSVIRDTAGHPQKLLLQIADITEKKEFEDLLQQRNSELEKANKELDRFVYSTSHDLRAPLRSILGLIYIMQNESNPDAMKTYLDMMRTSVNRMDEFIKEIVDLSKNSQLDVRYEKIDLKAVVAETFESLRYIAGAEKIEFSMDIHQDADFCSDVSRLKVILNNLIANAVTYHNFNQESPFIKVQAVIKNRYALVEVIDNGRGIKKEHQQKIFDMFYRASDDTKGSGLGLYIVKEAVNKLNGNIQIKSKPGAGTKFSIKIFNSCKDC